MAAFAKSWRREESFQQIIALSSVIDICYSHIYSYYSDILVWQRPQRGDAFRVPTGSF
jgi:hypothetical protein